MMTNLFESWIIILWCRLTETMSRATFLDETPRTKIRKVLLLMVKFWCSCCRHAPEESLPDCFLYQNFIYFEIKHDTFSSFCFIFGWKRKSCNRKILFSLTRKRNSRTSLKIIDYIDLLHWRFFAVVVESLVWVILHLSGNSNKKISSPSLFLFFFTIRMKTMTRQVPMLLKKTMFLLFFVLRRKPYGHCWNS